VRGLSRNAEMRQHPVRHAAALRGALRPGLVTAQARSSCTATTTASPATLTGRPTTLARFALSLSGTWASQAAAQALGQISRWVGRGSVRTLPPPISKSIIARFAP